MSALPAKRVARRMALGFIVSALVPLLMMAFLSYGQVRSHLDAQTEDQLKWLSKSYALQLYDRVQQLSRQIEVRAELAGTNEGREGPIDWRITQRSHVAQSPWRGAQPSLDVDVRKRLVRVTLESEAKTVSANVNWDYFWWGMAGERTLPAATEMAVLSSSTGALLFSSVYPPLHAADLRPLNTSQHSEEIEIRGTKFLARSYPIHLNTVHGSPTFDVVLAVRADQATIDFQRFRRSFPLLALAVLWLIILVSLVQIRKTLVPLRLLREATQRLTQRDYTARANVESNDEFADLAQAFNGMAEQIESHLETLKKESDLDRAVMSTIEAAEVGSTLAQRLPDLLPCYVAAVALLEKDGGEPSLFVREHSADVAHHRALAKSPRNEELELQEILRLTPAEAPPFLSDLGLSAVSQWTLAPVVVDAHVVAWLALGHTSEEPPALGMGAHLRRVADHAAVALSNARLVQNLDELSVGTLVALARAVDAKSPWTMGHSERVAVLSRRIGEAMDLPARDLEILYRGGLVHDVGKIGVPSAVLDKDGPLTDEEMAAMREHVVMGARIIQPITTLHDVLPVVLEHHEWLNGKGYPNGLKGDEISQLGRIAAVADAYDAITSARPYRDGRPPLVALEILKKDSGTQFDAQVVEALQQALSSELGISSRFIA